MKGKALLLLSLGLFFLVQAGGICWSQTTKRVSVDSAGDEALGPSFAPSISANGRYVAFKSSANNLVVGDLNGFIDVFVHDRDADDDGTYDDEDGTYDPGEVSNVRVSVDSAGIEGNRPSSEPSISSDGRHVAFESLADNLVAGDTPFPFGFPDIFVHDLQTGTTTWVSEDSLGGEADGPSLNPSISGDGRYVAFESEATGLVAPGGSDGSFHIFVRDRQMLTTTQVSVNSLGAQGNNHSYSPSISDDGRYVAFSSSATDLVASDDNLKFDIFVHDRDEDEDGIYDEAVPGGISTVRVSVASGGGEAHGDSNSPSISADGRYVAFDSDATDLVGVGNDTNGKLDIFVHDLQTVTTTRVSVASGGGEANGDSYFPSISGDGRYVAFESLATNLLGVGNDTNGKADIFVHDRDADGNGIYDEVGGISTVRVSVPDLNYLVAEANGNSYAPSISGDGSYVAYESAAYNLVPGDGNGISDIFTYERESLPPTVDSTSPANNANGVAVGSSITATFSEPMNGSTIDSNTFTLDKGVTGTVTYDANSTKATFTPTSRLDYNTIYTATITTGARDLEGISIQPDYTWSFTTQSEKNSGGSGPCFIATAASAWADF